MKKRVNTDLIVTLTLTNSDGGAKDTSDWSNVSVVAVRQNTTIKTSQDFTMKGNVITFQWDKIENKSVGTYDVMIVYELPRSSYEEGIDHEIIDIKDAFQIVTSSTEEQGVGEAIVVAVESGKDGLSAYEVWKKQYGTSESTIDDYIAYLQSPCKISTAEYSKGILTIKIG